MNLPSIPVSHALIDGLPTTLYLANIVGSLWKATKERCGAPEGCRVERRDMYLCEACREFYHLICIGDGRRKPSEDIPYLCPMHPRGRQISTHCQSFILKYDTFHSTSSFPHRAHKKSSSESTTAVQKIIGAISLCVTTSLQISI